MIVDNNFKRQYNPEDSSEHTRRRENLKSHNLRVVYSNGYFPLGFPAKSVYAFIFYTINTTHCIHLYITTQLPFPGCRHELHDSPPSTTTTTTTTTTGCGGGGGGSSSNGSSNSINLFTYFTTFSVNSTI
jgi:hypothetical protein